MEYLNEASNGASHCQRVLVVGGAGYLGSLAVPQLLQCGYRVRVLDWLLSGAESLAAVKDHPNFELVAGDIRQIDAVVQAMRGCHAVIHLAAIVGDPACEQNPELAVEVNRAGTRMLLAVARDAGVRRFILASTCSVYGASDAVLEEDSPLAPLSTYARTKQDSEEMVLAAAATGFEPVVLRIGTLFGLSPRMRFDLVVNLLVSRALTHRRITIYNGSQWRPLVHVADVARSTVLFVRAPAAAVSGEVFNVGDDSMNHQLAEIGAAVASQVPGTEVQHIENADRRNYRVAFAKIRSRLGFCCERRLTDGIREIHESLATAAAAAHHASPG